MGLNGGGTTPTIKNIINHIGLVLDASSSMEPHRQQLVQVVDNLIKHLATSSQGMDQETRISVWSFNFHNNIRCLIWDKDVVRTPSIADFYRTDGMTALVDATFQSMRDLSEIPERYGDHSYLVYVLTDGAENNSQKPASALNSLLTNLKDHWTFAALVPNAMAKHQAKQFGFPAGNIEVWDTTSSVGVSEVGEKIRQATDTYMTNRASGVRSTTGLFSTDITTVNAQTIQANGLVPLARDKYMLVPVPKDTVIADFTKECGHNYRTGNGYYELSKTETIQPHKNVAIVERGPSGRVFIGRDARTMVGLPDAAIRVKPNHNPDFAVFVQSTSNNRKLKVGTKYLYLV